MTIERLVLSLSEKPGQKERELGIMMSFFNNGSHDRRGPITLDLMEGDAKLATATTKTVRVEQWKAGNANAVLAVPVDVSSARSGMKLRMTVQMEPY